MPLTFVFCINISTITIVKVFKPQFIIIITMSTYKQVASRSSFVRMFLQPKPCFLLEKVLQIVIRYPGNPYKGSYLECP